jgi:hypothetical protein
VRRRDYRSGWTHIKWRPGDARELFARHLDLEPLRGRSRGLVACIFHQDGTPSLSVDLDDGLFHCFGCGAQGGVRQLAELVGESGADDGRPRAPAREPESELDRARRRVAHREAAAARRRAEWIELWRAADFIREAERLALRCYQTAGELEGDAAWAAVGLSAQLEREARLLEMAFDACLAPPMSCCP